MRPWAFVAVIAPLLACGLSNSSKAQTAAAYETVKIVRDVKWVATNPRMPKNNGTLRIELDLELQPDGTLAGSGSYVWHWRWEINKQCGVPLSIWHGEAKFELTGTQKNGVVSVTAPKDISALNKRLYEGCTYRENTEKWNIYNNWHVFQVKPQGGQIKTQERQNFNILPSPVDATVTTQVTATLAPAIRVVVAAKHEIIPGHLRYFNELSVTLSGPQTDPTGMAVHVRLGGGDQGRLSEDQGWSGSPTLRLAAVKPGETRKFYYAWGGAPPTAVHKATVTASVQGEQAEGSASFDVGVNFKVERVSPLVGSISTGKRELIGVWVRDTFHPDKDPGASADELGIRPVLGMKQTGFVPLADLQQFVDGLSLNAGRLLEFAIGSATGGRAVAVGNQLSWTVGKGGQLIGRGVSEDQGYPTILFQDRGVYVFEFDITALAHADGRMPEPPSEPHQARFKTTELDPNAAFLFDMLAPCIAGLVGALKEDPLAQAQALWQCLHGALSSELAQQAIGHNVIANTIGGLIAQAIDAGFMAAGHSPEAAAQQVGEQTIEMIQEQMKRTPDTYAVLVGKGGVKQLAATSSTAGELERGPEKLDLRAVRAQTDEDRARVAADYSPRRRIQEGKNFTVVAARNGEALRFDLVGTGDAGEILIVGPAGVTRAAYPAGEWTSQIEVQTDGTLRTLSGAPLRAQLKPAAGSALPAQVSQAPSGRTVIGGRCTYNDIAGQARIVRIEKTAASTRQASIAGGPGYEGYKVEFQFTPATPIAEAQVREFVARPHFLRLANSWYPGPAYLKKYNIASGVVVPATLRVRISGSCTPMIFAFPSIDLTDYFEKRQ
jgi:hypothetical protein